MQAVLYLRIQLLRIFLRLAVDSTWSWDMVELIVTAGLNELPVASSGCSCNTLKMEAENLFEMPINIHRCAYTWLHVARAKVVFTASSIWLVCAPTLKMEATNSSETLLLNVAFSNV
jgi:hypothetical protein